MGIRTQARGEETEKTAALKTVAEFAARIARAELRAHARIHVSGPAIDVGIGPVKLLQIVLNLLVNSAHAVQRQARAGVIEVRWEPEGAQVRLEVVDNGCGIPEALRQKVFEPLFTTKPVGMGTGLGLGIIRDFVLEAGGTVTLQSVPGEGTTFTIMLPVATPAG